MLQGTRVEMSHLSNLSDPQSKEIVALFKFFDTDRDGLISPRTAIKLCAQLGFHLEPAAFAGDPGSSPLTQNDLLNWCDNFCGQCLRSDDLRLAQRFALLRACDEFATGPRVSRDALLQFLASEQHQVQDEAVDALIIEMGTDGQLSKDDMAMLIGGRKRAPPARTTDRPSGERIGAAR